MILAPPSLRLRCLAALGLGLTLAACAAAPPTAPPSAPPTAAPPATPPGPGPVAVAPTPPEPSPLDQLVAAHRDQARALEQAGRLRRALEEWKIALTLNPADPAALEGRKRLEDQIERTIGERVKQGKDLLARGEPLEARRHFLVVLALDPSNVTAFEALQTQIKELRFVNHTVRRGETLATIAERYYGDRSRSEVIWEVNQLPPNPRLAAGTILRVPEIPGVPFINPEARAPAPPAPEAGVRPERPDAAVPDLKAPATREETVEINPLLVEAREALEKGEHLIALADVEQVLSGNAQNPEGLDLKKAILYGLGKAQLNQRKYDESYQTFTQLAKLAPNYQDSPALLRQTRERLVQQHYSQGLRLFQEEKLEDAIGQWRLVLELDPQHPTAKKNLEQAERLLKNLQQRQQPKKP